MSSLRSFSRYLIVIGFLTIGLFFLSNQSVFAAKHVTPNFEVEAPTAAIAEQVALELEKAYMEESMYLMGGIKPPNLFKPVKVQVKVGQIGAGGATTFSFGGGEVFGWEMTMQGSLERILDSVIPHEVHHMILAIMFRRPLPRAVDEGCATLAESESELRRQCLLAFEGRNAVRKGICSNPNDFFGIMEYPKNMKNVLELYALGQASMGKIFLLGGKENYIKFLNEVGKGQSVNDALKNSIASKLEPLEPGENYAGALTRIIFSEMDAAARSGDKGGASYCSQFVKKFLEVSDYGKCTQSKENIEKQITKLQDQYNNSCVGLLKNSAACKSLIMKLENLQKQLASL